MEIVTLELNAPSPREYVLLLGNLGWLTVIVTWRGQGWAFALRPRYGEVPVESLLCEGFSYLGGIGGSHSR